MTVAVGEAQPVAQPGASVVLGTATGLESRVAKGCETVLQLEFRGTEG